MISKMKKLMLVAARGDIDSITNDLLWMSAVEIRPAETEAEEGLAVCDTSSEIAEYERRAAVLSEAVDTLAVYGSKKNKKGGAPAFAFAFTRESFEELRVRTDEALEKAEKVRMIARENAAYRSEINRCDTEILNLRPWLKLDISLSLESTASTDIIKGSLPYDADLPGISIELSDECEGAIVGEVSRDRAYIYIYAVFLSGDREKLTACLSRHGFSKMSFGQYNGTCAEEIKRLKEEKSQLEAKTDENLSKIKEYASDRRFIESVYDYIGSVLEKLKMKNQFICTENTFILNGWIPAEAVKRLKDKLSSYECYYELSDPEEGEEVPVMLSNTKFASPFESIIAMYSYPKYGTFDPTFIMGIFYAVIFGLIMQDVGYGLLLAVGCPLLIKLMRPKESTKKMLKAFTLCGISTIICGVLFGGYFSDFPHQIAVNFFGASSDTLSDMALLFNPIENNMGFLILTLAVGVVHMVTGMLIKAYMLIKEGDVFSAVFDVGSWLVLFAGIGCMAVFPPIGKWIAVIGALMLVFTQGRDSKSIIGKFFKGLYSLYNIINYLSDLLSYSRIFALGLSGAIIGQVMNILGTLAGRNVVGFIVLIIIFVFGHVLNLALSIISSFVHTARLQYIEFFGKFYIDGGRPFKPASVNTKFSEIKEEAKQS